MKTPTFNSNLSYSQNFLKDTALVARIVKNSSISNADTVYEIGAGKGVITEELVKHSATVIAYELDESLFNTLKTRLVNYRSLELRHEDFLKATLPNTPYKVFSNIPFNITADLVHKLTEAVNPPEDTYLIMQKEAASKFAGNPLGKETLTSTLMKPKFELTVSYFFKRTDFQPAPKVETVLINIKKRPIPLIKEETNSIYKDFISYAFSQWKPSLKDTLKPIFTDNQFSHLSKDLRFSLVATPSQLTFEQWLGLFNYFLVGVEKNKQTLVVGFYSRLISQQQTLQKVHRTRLDKNWRK